MRLPRPSFLLCIALAGCAAAPAPQSAGSTPSAPQPFTVPMDPGQISCASLTNPAALTAATDWMLGQMRAQVLAGRRTHAPAAAQVSADLQEACQSNAASTIRDVARQTGP